MSAANKSGRSSPEPEDAYPQMLDAPAVGYAAAASGRL